MVLAFVVGKRTQANANLLLQRVAHLTDQRIPFFTSDQLPEYCTALLQVYGRWVQPPRNGHRGRFPQPCRLPLPDLLYAQVVKRRRRGHIVAVTTKAIFGEPRTIATRLASLPTSTTVNTSYVERENLTLRQHNRRLTRKINGKGIDLTGKTTLAVLGVLSSGAAPRELAAAPVDPRTYPGPGIETALDAADTSNGSQDHGSCLDDSGTIVVSGSGFLSGQTA